MYKVRRQPLSQNFLWNRELVTRLIRASSVTQNDLVLEIGPGKGIITERLTLSAREVIAVELDARLNSRLKFKFSSATNLTLHQGNILSYDLPTQPYKVFSNIPFAITGDLIRKLLLSSNPPIDCFLIVQKEAALKFIASSGPNTLAAFLYYPFWNIKILHEFSKRDFYPSPEVNCVLLRIQRRAASLISLETKQIYQDFLCYYFGRDRFSKYLHPDAFLASFHHFLNTANSQRLKSIQGAFAKLQLQQQKLSKIHRTRTNPRWKIFR